ncbi:MAG: glycosyltransferase family 4 protein [Anaerolineales bacterium]
MRILFVADGRSPIALNWIGYFVDQGYEVHLASTFPSAPEIELASLHIAPVAFSSAAGGRQTGKGGILRGVTTARMRTLVRQGLGPLTLAGAGRRLNEIIATIRPDLVHAMRIPYEGMIAALAQPAVPLLISVWGNDFTLHAVSNPIMARYTRLALRRADALHTDCHRDLRLGYEWGFERGKPGVVLPGGGGVQPEIFYPPDRPQGGKLSPFTIINPRGFRAYVHNKAFFKAIPLVLKKHPQTRFLCPTMEGEAQAVDWMHTANIAHAVELFPKIPRTQMADLFRRAQVAVSPSSHDGTPNTLLEAMACGCFPVAGDIESIREWITDGENGLLVDPANPRAIAEGIVRALENAELRAQAMDHNLRLVAERAEFGRVMREAERFYRSLFIPPRSRLRKSQE